jgi:hypothetical protein
MDLRGSKTFMNSLTLILEIGYIIKVIEVILSFIN